MSFEAVSFGGCCVYYPSIIFLQHVHTVLKIGEYTLFFNKNVVFSAQAEYSYFSADFRLKIFLYYSYDKFPF